MNKIGKMIMLIFGVLFFVLFGESVSFADDNTDKIIAVVDGISITYKDVQVHEDTIKFDSVLSQLQDDDLQEELVKREQQRLLFQIEGIIINKAINEFNITVSEEEVDTEFDSNVEMVNLSEEDVENITNTTARIVETLELWQKNPEREKEIYEDKLSGIITYREWGIFKNLYNTPEKITEAKKLVPESLDDIKDMSKEGIIEQIKLRKLKDAVSINAKVTDNEVEKFYNQRYPEILSWDAYHFYSLDRPMLVNIREHFKSGDEAEEIIQDYNLSNSPKGGISREVYYPEIAPFYAQGIYTLSSGDVNRIIEGPLYLGWPGAEIPERFKGKENDMFYHFIFLVDVNRKEGKPEYGVIKDEIKRELLNLKKEEIWNEWLHEQVIESDIIIIDKRYNNILKKLTN
jgi:hypothetical protein